MPRLQPPPLTPLTPRQPQALLDQFFNQMPKGGDIHLHYSGGIYTEVLIASALQYDMKLCEVSEARGERERGRREGGSESSSVPRPGGRG